MQTVHATLKYLSHRDQLGAHLAKAGFAGKIVEVGTLYGAFASVLARSFPGQVVCVDPWANQPQDVYHDGANHLDMEGVYQQAKATLEPMGCRLIRAYSLAGAAQFKDGELDAVYLDGNHALQAVRDDIAAWWPKVKIGGIVSGHDFFTRYDKDTNSDAQTAVMELADRLDQRPHVTWCTSWYFVKTAEADAKFRGVKVAPKVAIDRSKTPVVPVLAVSHADFHLAVKWLRWASRMAQESKVEIPLRVWASKALNEEHIAVLTAALEGIGSNNVVKQAPELFEKGYAPSANYQFRTALEMMTADFPGCAMLWCEADTVPMHARWLRTIEAEYRKHAKPFMGDIVRYPANGEPGIDHMTGTGVYPPDWRELAPSLQILPEPRPHQGWDSMCAHEILPQAAQAQSIKQVWRPAPMTLAWMKANKATPNDIALFHQCKDGTMIDVLVAESGGVAIELGQPLPKYVAPKPVVTTPDGTAVEIMVVACARDKAFLRYCLDSIKRNARGFSGVTLVVPELELAAFAWAKPYAKLRGIHEPAGKGMLAHEVAICRADEHCPDAGAIVHVDADCVFWEPVSAGDYVRNGKCLMVREKYEWVGQRNPNRLIWRDCVERATGLRPEWETMVRHPNVYPRSLYAHTRKVVEQHTGRDFDGFVYAQENGFPQGFAEFPTLGAVGIADMPQLFDFVDYDHAADQKIVGIGVEFQYAYMAGRDHLVETWSHGGINRYRQHLDAWAAGTLPRYFVK